MLLVFWLMVAAYIAGTVFMATWFLRLCVDAERSVDEGYAVSPKDEDNLRLLRSMAMQPRMLLAVCFLGWPLVVAAVVFDRFRRCVLRPLVARWRLWRRRKAGAQ